MNILLCPGGGATRDAYDEHRIVLTSTTGAEDIFRHIKTARMPWARRRFAQIEARTSVLLLQKV